MIISPRPQRIRSVVLLVSAFCIFISLPIPTWAEMITYAHVVRQPFNGSQSPDDARTAALIKAKREVLEKAGTYLDSVKIVKDHQLVQNQITALSSAILQAEIVSQKNYVEGATFGIEIEAKVIIDTATLEERIKNFLKDQSAFEKAQRLEQREKELLAKIKELEARSEPFNKTKIKNSAKERNTGKLIREFAEVTSKLSAIEANRRALTLWNGTKFVNPEKAVAYLDEAIRKDAKSAEAYNSRGIARANLGEWRQALKDHDSAIQLEPHFSDALNNRGAAYARLGEMQKAMQDFDMAIKLNPHNASFYFNRGTGYANLNQLESACADLDKAVELSPKDISIRTNRGIVLFKSELYEDAVSDFDYVLYVQPNQASAYKYRGLCYFMMGDGENFCSDLEWACKYGDCESLRKMQSMQRCNQQYLAAENKNPDVATQPNDRREKVSLSSAKPVKNIPDVHMPASKSRPVTIESLENALIADVDSRLIAKKIHEKGVDFELTEEIQARLNRVNADKIIINAIVETKKKNRNDHIL